MKSSWAHGVETLGKVQNFANWKLKIFFTWCKKEKTAKNDAMRKCECDAKMRKKFASHRSLNKFKKTGKLIDRSLFRNRIRIALPALLSRIFELFCIFPNIFALLTTFLTTTKSEKVRKCKGKMWTLCDAIGFDKSANGKNFSHYHPCTLVLICDHQLLIYD